MQIISADLARQAFEHDLFDDMQMFVAPVFLGDGTRIVDGPGVRASGRPGVRAAWGVGADGEPGSRSARVGKDLSASAPLIA